MSLIDLAELEWKWQKSQLGPDLHLVWKMKKRKRGYIITMTFVYYSSSSLFYDPLLPLPPPPPPNPSLQIPITSDIKFSCWSLLKRENFEQNDV